MPHALLRRGTCQTIWKEKELKCKLDLYKVRYLSEIPVDCWIADLHHLLCFLFPFPCNFLFLSPGRNLSSLHTITLNSRVTAAENFVFSNAEVVLNQFSCSHAYYLPSLTAGDTGEITGQKYSMTDYVKDTTGLKGLLYLELIMSSISFGKAIADL